MSSVGQRLELKVGTSLVMTPQLQQAIKLLQLSAVELQDYVDQELEQNPLLERGDPDRATNQEDANNERAGNEGGEQPKAEDTKATAADDTNSFEGESAPDLIDRQHDSETFDAAFDSEYDNVWTNGDAEMPQPSMPSWEGASTGSGSGGGNRMGDDELELEQRYSRPPDLREHLAAQIPLEITDATERLIANALLDTLNGSGYVEADLDELAEQLGCETDAVETVLAKLQRLDPAGIFARDLVDCLRLQLMDRNRFDPAMASLLDNLDLLAACEFNKLRKLCAVDEEDFAEMVAELKSLDPKPAASFDIPAAEAIVPDIFIRPNPQGGWLVELNPDALPKVLVNQAYHAQVSSKVTDKADKEYISEQFQSANWLVKSLHQRASTILKVSSELVRQQDGFFRHGVRALKPLVLRDIAEAVEMHESTISRVTTNKFLSCPRGIFELKYFFTAAIAGADGEASHSAEAVKHRIKAMIDAEPPAKILSDDKIVALLREDGIDIARRTVAKYREAMKIPSSVQRRREKRQLR
ncbi:MAG: RNA polymerase factor sigma-54 [Pseudomonadota bacterium]